MYRLLAAVLFLSCLTSCVSRGFPTHGGGKRFYYEQHLVSKSADKAIAELDFEELARTLDGDAVGLYVVAVGDEGGGVDGAGALFGIFSPAGMTPAVHGTSSPGLSEQGYGAYPVSNARDIEYVRARVMQQMVKSGIRVVQPHLENASIGGNVYVLVSEFGIAKDRFTVIVYSERRLTARTALEGFFVPTVEEEAVRFLGEGACSYSYEEAFALGFGPINEDSDRFETQMGSIPGSDE